MYLGHFGLNEPPFRITPHTEFFFDGANRGPTLEALVYAITHDEGIVKVTGEVGSGKTMLCRVLMERLPDSVETVYLANPSLSRDEILHSIADELHLQLASDRSSRLLRDLQEQLIARYAAGRRVVVLIDEAHAMPKDTLEEVRLLSNLETDRHKLLQIVLFGQPELNELLGGMDMRQLKERITHSFRLEPFVTGDVESYIDFRMRAAGYRGPKVFTPRAVRRIAAAAQGLTRRVNILADKSLLAAFAGGTHAVTEKEARAAIRDSDFHQPRVSRKWWLAAALVVLGLALGAAGEHLMQPPSPPVVRAAATAAAAAAPAPAAASSSLPAPLSTALPTASPTASPTAAPAQIGSAANSVPAAQPAIAPDPANVTGAANAAETQQAAGPQPPAGKVSRRVFEATQAWLKSGPEDGYSIQLLTVKAEDIANMERFLTRASNQVPLEELHLYSVKINGGQYYRATYGYFPDRQKIAPAIKELPGVLAAQAPYVRSLARMRSQNRQ